MKKFFVIMSLAIAFAGCTRIETGEVGLRVDISKQVQMEELKEGSWNQTLVGDVLTFPIRDVAVDVKDARPITADNTALSEFDATVVYSVNPASVGELYAKKSKAFHNYVDGDYLLMHKYMEMVINKASAKVVRRYKALEANDNLDKVENELRELIVQALADENLDKSLHVNAVKVSTLRPPQDIINSAAMAVKKENELRAKEAEVQIAKKEAERVSILAANRDSIAYINAQTQLKIAEGIAAGKVQTIVVPYDFQGIVTTGK